VTKLKKPFAIEAMTWFAALAAAGMFLSILLAIYDIGPHIMAGERVTRDIWLHIAAPFVAVIGILMALCVYGFRARKFWSRHLVLAIFSLIIIYATALGTLSLIHHAIIWRAIINAAVFGCASIWYFYLKPNVSIYFRGLKKSATPK